VATKAKGTGARTTRIAIYARNAVARKWIETELADQPCEREVAETIRELVYALVAEGLQRPQALVADFDGMSPADVLELHSIRERGWFGSIVALGAVTRELRTSLSVEHVIERPFKGGELRKVIARIGLDRATTKMPKLKP
jgi:hypothetical protein